MAEQTTRAIGYIRRTLTTDTDSSNKTDIATQRIRTYCTLNRITLVDILFDDARDASPDARPTLRAALSALADGRADALIVPNLATLSRSIVALTPWIDEHFGERSPYALISVLEQIDTRHATGRLSLGILSALSMFERGSRHA